MIATIQQKLSDSPKARWTALIIVALTMMMGYFVTDVVSPLSTLLKQSAAQGSLGMGWTGTEYGFFAGSYSILNIFLLMLFFGGIILDKLGIRFTGLMATALMAIGALTKWWALAFIDPTITVHVPFTLFGMIPDPVKLQVLVAALGFAIFGVGCEVTGITVSKIITKWFTGHELALAMGLQVALARLGTAAALSVSPLVATKFQSIALPVMLGAVLLVVGFLTFIVYMVMDVKLDRSMPSTADNAESQEDEGFKFADLGLIFSNVGFWLIALLCLLFYSAVFPFLKFASDLMVNKYGVSVDLAGIIPSILPYGTIVLTPLFGTVYDKVGKGATLMIIGSLMLTLCHVCFALPVLNTVWFAVIVMVLLGISFSLVPSAMWPSVAKIIPIKQLGSAFALIFFIQNIGLMLVPMFIGKVIEDNTDAAGHVNFTMPMVIFAAFGVCAILLAILLRVMDGQKGYGLEQPNIKK